MLQTKFDWTKERARQAILEISQTATVLSPRPTLHLLNEEPDNRILECALAAEAQWIVTGDRHLLGLGTENMQAARSSRWQTSLPNSACRLMPVTAKAR